MNAGTTKDHIVRQTDDYVSIVQMVVNYECEEHANAILSVFNSTRKIQQIMLKLKK